ERRRRKRDDPPVPRRDLDLHHSRLPLPHGRRAGHQLPPAALDAVHAGQRLLGPCDHARRLRTRDCGRLPVLFLRRRLAAVAHGVSGLAFRIDAREGAARAGAISTPRGDIRTPAFMPLGTSATVKALTVDQVRATGADIILGNTYHLMLRPGPERIAR